WAIEKRALVGILHPSRETQLFQWLEFYGHFYSVGDSLRRIDREEEPGDADFAVLKRRRATMVEAIHFECDLRVQLLVQAEIEIVLPVRLYSSDPVARVGSSSTEAVRQQYIFQRMR